ncbi:MAG TPA: hypothetical protein VIH57_02450 [Bacteroidales bacterium]
MDEIKLSILNQILKIDKELKFDRRLITNDIDLLDNILIERNKKHKILMIVSIVILIFACVIMPIFESISGFHSWYEFGTLPFLYVFLMLLTASNFFRHKKIKANVETKIFLLRLVHSLDKIN